MSEKQPDSFLSIFLVFLRLGLTSFGGPVAHIGYFRDEFVARRKWLSERSYADTVALCQFLPGPASSQVGLAVGIYRGGYAGAAAAWLGFTMPSAIALSLFAFGLLSHGDLMPSGALAGLKAVAVAVVAQAVWGMGSTLSNGTRRATITILAACVCLLMPGVAGQLGVIGIGGLVGLALFSKEAEASTEGPSVRISKTAGVVWVVLFFLLLAGLPFLAAFTGDQSVSAYDSFYRSGSLVFGGGHVVLPLLQAEVVPTGLVDKDTFLAGYGAAQAVPGPLFTFASFLGSSMESLGPWWLGGLICLLAIFTPSFLLVAGALPFWATVRANIRMQSALVGINAAVVGILVAALYDPVWTSGIAGAPELAMALVALAALVWWKLPPWLVVLAGAIAGGVLL